MLARNVSHELVLKAKKAKIFYPRTMINDRKISRNYATALFELAIQNNFDSKVLELLISIDALLFNNPSLQEFLSSPIAPKADKSTLALKLLEGLKAPDFFVQFFLLLIANSRIGILSKILELYNGLLNDAHNTKVIKVISSSSLKAKDQQELKIYLENLIQKKVIMELFEDSSIINGLVIKYDNFVLDYSVKGILDNLKKK